MGERIVYDVLLHNEGEGYPVLYDVTALSPEGALIEAWRQYRNLPYIDMEKPPEWTYPIVQPALGRPGDGEAPTVTPHPGADWYHPQPPIVAGFGPESFRPYGEPPKSR